jgi:hypothetical protein
MKADSAVKKANQQIELTPARKGGRRNIFCPHYSECLDLVIQKQWMSWGCRGCRHRFDESGRAELQCGTEHAVPYYELGTSI